MQKLLYAATALVALGLGYAIVNYETPGSVDGTVGDTTVATAVSTEAGSMTLEVPNMHCEFSCYPKVKGVLEQSDAVRSVDLASQPEDGPFNPQVVVNYDAGFDLAAVRADLQAAGYADTSVVQ